MIIEAVVDEVPLAGHGCWEVVGAKAPRLSLELIFKRTRLFEEISLQPPLPIHPMHANPHYLLQCWTAEENHCRNMLVLLNG